MDRLEALGNTLSQVTMYDIKSYYNTAKNMVLNLSEMEVKVREATNDEPWGASSTLMNEIAQGTFSFQTFNEIMPAIYARFMEKEARQWRQIYKALQLLEYLIKNGSERTVDDARSHISTIKMLRNFHYIDEKGKDQGLNVRNRAREIVELLADLDKVRQERRKAKANKNKYTGTGNDGEMSFSSGSGGRYGGFGSEGLYGSGGGGGGGGGSGGGSYDRDYGGYGESGLGAGGGGFKDESYSGNKKFQEYDAGDDEELPSPRTRTSTTTATTTSSGHTKRQNSTTTAPPPPKAKAKAPEVDLLGGFDDEPTPAFPAPPGKDKALPATGGNIGGLDDDFGDFEGAPTTIAAAPQAQAKPNVFEFLSQTQIQPQPAMGAPGHTRQLSGGMGGMGGTTSLNMGGMMSSLPTMQPQQPQRQASYTSPSTAPLSMGSMGMGMGGGGMLSPSAFTTTTTSMMAPMSATSSFAAPKPTTTQQQQQQPPKTSGAGGGGFDDLWNLSLTSKPTASAPVVGGGKSIQQLEKEKAQAGIWGAAAPSAPAANNSFGNFGGSMSGGGGDDNLLL